MPHDLVIRNANVVDGTGADPFPADIAVDGKTISAIGKVEEKGTEEIDADGHAVTPGFVDLHTHLDAQIGWDHNLTSITWHGVTTALLGNCGVTFAPCKKDDREFLAGMMETVEDIPKHAIMTGLPWDWESYGEYLNSIERNNPMINVAGLVGHCATRTYVMGERAIEEPATKDEIRQIAALAGQSVKDGALGFSTNRHLGHLLPDGRCIPGTHAEYDELRAIAKAVGEHGGIMQTVMNFTQMEKEMDLIGEEAAMCRGALFSAVAGATSEQGNLLNDKVMKFRGEGHDITGITVPRAGGGVTGLSANLPFPGESWNELRKLDFDGRLAAIRDGAMRDKLVSDARANPNDEALRERSRNWFPMGLEQRPNYTGGSGDNIYDLAQAAGEHPVETWLRITLETDGKMLFHMRGFNVNLDTLEEMITTEWAMPGLGDAGAHVSQMCDSGWSSFVLAHWHRDHGTYTLAEAVRRIAAVPAGVLGLDDRGVLAVGKRADINVIDIDRVAECQPEMVHDFPGGAPRFIQRGVGYLATVCNGTVVLKNDEHTGLHAGEVLRS